MRTITLPNIRSSSDLTVNVRLKDSGVAIDWSTLSRIKAFIYSDAQRAVAGRCDVSVDGEDPTLLVCEYSATKPQYLGVNRIIVTATYMGETKTYDKPCLNFVRWTDDQEGEQITIDDPTVEVEIVVEDVSSSILQEAVDAANTAAERANEAAEAAEHMVDIHTGPEGKSAYEVAVEEGYTGTEEEWLASLVGAEGKSAYELAVEHGFEGTEEEWLESLKGNPGVGLQTVTTQQDGTLVLHLTNGDTVTIDLNHNHVGYYSKVVGTSQPSGGFLPDVIYKLGTISDAAVTFALAAAVQGNANHYYWTFETGSTPPTPTWPSSGFAWADGVGLSTLAANKHYEISVMDGIATYLEV